MGRSTDGSGITLWTTEALLTLKPGYTLSPLDPGQAGRSRQARISLRTQVGELTRARGENAANELQHAPVGRGSLCSRGRA